MNVGEYIKYLRKNMNLSQQELGDLVGVKRLAVIRWEKGETQNLKRSTIQKLSDVFNVSPSNFVFCEELNLEFKNEDSAPKLKQIPILGEIACGNPILCNNTYDFITVDKSINADFCVIAKGDSMINARIFDGDLVLVRSQQDVENGEIAVVIVDDEATLKRVYKIGKTIELRAENPKYKPLVYSGNELKQIRILGKAMFFASEVI